jgi:4-amino-4-deoxy-L-arabinose transferase-like glycosyltransferase
VAELPFFTGEGGRAQLLILLFFISVSVVTVWGTWRASLPASDEAVLAETGREVLATGDPWTMHFDGLPVHDTPPLVPWLMALFYAAFGVNEFTARFPFVLLSVLTFYIVYLAGKRASRDREDGSQSVFGSLATGLGFLSCIFLASSPYFGRYAPHITLGVPFAFFAAVALLGWLSMPRVRGGAVLWGTGIAGALLSFGAGAFLLILGALLSSIVDRERRVAWRSPGFIAATIAGIVAGGVWLFPETARSAQPLIQSPLWAPLAAIVHPSGKSMSSLLASARNTLLGNLPWTVPAVVAAVRIVYLRGDRRREAWVADIDADLLIFAGAVFFPLALSASSAASTFVAALPFAAILSAREIARWFKHSKRGVAQGVWTCNHVMTALFCLLMLLLVATPLHLRGMGADPIEDVARMANRLTPEGARIGNYGQRYREQCARMLFYGNRALEKPSPDATAVAAALRDTPGMIFLSSIDDLEALRRTNQFPFEVRVLYGSGNLVLFGATQAFPEDAP